MPSALIPYRRTKAVAYAHQWAFGRNPAYYNFDSIGGDCTNFASQCLYAGSGIMNYTPTFGWYYLTADNRTPSWTGVPYFYQFLTRKEQSPGPVAIETTLDNCEPGDFVQLNFSGAAYQHTPIIVQKGSPATLWNTLVAAHTYDTDNYSLGNYNVKEMRFLHIIGIRTP